MEPERQGPLRWVARQLVLTCGAVLSTLVLFLVLPLMQTIGNPMPKDWDVRGVDTGNLTPPPPPPPIEEIEEEEPPPPPPQLTETAPPLDLAQLELSLDPGLGDALFGDFVVNLPQQLQAGGGRGEEADRIFSLDDLDRRPQVVFQRVPNYPPGLRRSNREGTVYVVFQVDTTGRVVDPVVQKSTDSAFDASALEAVRQWRFEPGTRNGRKVSFKMRVPITFDAG